MVDDILSIIGNINILIVAYRTVRKNKGAMTKACRIPENELNQLNSEEKVLMEALFDAPDRLDREVLEQVSKLIKNNIYPWGVSKFIWQRSSQNQAPRK